MQIFKMAYKFLNGQVHISCITFLFPISPSAPLQQTAGCFSPQLHLDLPSIGSTCHALFLPEMLFDTHFSSPILLTAALKVSSSRKDAFTGPSTSSTSFTAPRAQCTSPLWHLSKLHFATFMLIMSLDSLSVRFHEDKTESYLTHLSVSRA